MVVILVQVQILVRKYVETHIITNSMHVMMEMLTIYS